MNFYHRKEWRELRYRVLRKYGWRCMSCRTSPPKGAVIHVDHIKPVSIYPELALEESNLQVLCELCNYGKSNVFQDDLRNDPNVISKPSHISKSDRRIAAAARLTRILLKRIERAERRNDTLAIAEGWNACHRIRLKLEESQKGVA